MKKIFFFSLILTIVFSSSIFADERAERTLEMLRQLAGNPSIWSSNTGNANITRINNSLERAANQGPSENNVLYVAARSITIGITQEQYNALIGRNRQILGNYIDTMILMESGISPQLMVAIINEILKQPPDREMGHYLYFTRLLNLPTDAAASLALIGHNHISFLTNPIFPGSNTTNNTVAVNEAIRLRDLFSPYFDGFPINNYIEIENRLTRLGYKKTVHRHYGISSQTNFYEKSQNNMNLRWQITTNENLIIENQGIVLFVSFPDISIERTKELIRALFFEIAEKINSIPNIQYRDSHRDSFEYIEIIEGIPKRFYRGNGIEIFGLKGIDLSVGNFMEEYFLTIDFMYIVYN